MQIAMVGAGYTAGEADQLRRDMAGVAQDRAGSSATGTSCSQGFAQQRDRARLRRAALPADPRLRRVRLPRVARRELRAPGVRVGVDQGAPPGGVRVRAPQLAADGLLQPLVDRQGRAAPRRRGPPSLRRDERLGLDAGAGRRAATAGAPPRATPDPRASARGWRAPWSARAGRRRSRSLRDLVTRAAAEEERRRGARRGGRARVDRAGAARGALPGPRPARGRPLRGARHRAGRGRRAAAAPPADPARARLREGGAVDRRSPARAPAAAAFASRACAGRRSWRRSAAATW